MPLRAILLLGIIDSNHSFAYVSIIHLAARFAGDGMMFRSLFEREIVKVIRGKRLVCCVLGALFCLLSEPIRDCHLHLVRGTWWREINSSA